MNQLPPWDNAIQETHPLLTRVKVAIDRGQKFEVDVRNDEDRFGLDGYQLSVWKAGDADPLFECPWDAEVNEELIGLRVRAKELNSESYRFALRLRDELKATEIRYGNGFFNQTLVDLLTESYLDKHPDIKTALERSYGRRVQRTAQYDACRDTIGYVIGKRSRELTGPLSYLEAEMREILSKAIAKYVDHRFSLSARKEMGLL